MFQGSDMFVCKDLIFMMLLNTIWCLFGLFSTGEAKSGAVQCFRAGLAGGFPKRPGSSSATRGLRHQPQSNNQEGFWFPERRYVLYCVRVTWSFILKWLPRPAGFLSPAGPLLAQAEAALTKRPMSNTRRVADRNLGPMLPATRNLLREFHQPFNHKLASVLDNNDFLWSSTWRTRPRMIPEKPGQETGWFVQRFSVEMHSWTWFWLWYLFVVK